MTLNVVSIVEGQGEVAALPVLLRRLKDWKTPGCDIQILTPIRVSRMRFLNRDEEFSRHLQLAARKCGERGWILILLDADDDCPNEFATNLHIRARRQIPHREIAVVLANREYEAWFIAAAASLDGWRGLEIGAMDRHVEAERPRDAKGWLAERKVDRSGYHEITDQPAYSARIDLELAFDRSRSFRKLCGEWVKKTALLDPAA